MDRTMRRPSVHALTEESHVFHFLANKSSWDADLFASNDHYFLAVKELFRYDRRKSAKHMVPGIHHHSLCTYSGAGNHSRVVGDGEKCSEGLGTEKFFLLRRRDVPPFYIYKLFLFRVFFDQIGRLIHVHHGPNPPTSKPNFNFAQCFVLYLIIWAWAYSACPDLTDVIF